MPCDHCPSTAVSSAMRVRFRPLSTRATIPAAAMSGWRSPSPRGLDLPGWIGARPKGLPARLQYVPRAREDPAGPWTGHPSCYSAAHPATGPSASSIRPAQRRPRICLSALDSIPVCSLRWVHRTDNVSVVILRRTTTRFSRKGGSVAELFRIPPTTLARRPYAGRRQVGETYQCETRVSGGRGVYSPGAGSRGIGPNWSGARCGSQTKESPFPSKPKGRGKY